MPYTSHAIPEARRGATSPFMYGCGVHGVVHTLIPNMRNPNIPAAAKQELLTKFDAWYGTHLLPVVPPGGSLPAGSVDAAWVALTEKLQNIESPLRREIILGPVLRQMSNVKELREEEASGSGSGSSWKPITSDEVMHIANKFNITVESYTSHEAFKAALVNANSALKTARREIINEAQIAKEVEEEFAGVIRLGPAAVHGHPDRNGLPPNIFGAASVATLKLLNTTGNHWEYEIANPAELASHNAFYRAGCPYNERDNARIKECIRNAFTSGENLNVAFHRYESTRAMSAAPGTGMPMPAGFAKVMDFMKNITGQLGGEENVFLKGVIGVLGPLLGLLFGFMGMFKGFIKQFNPSAALDEEDFSKYPRKEEAGLFEQYINKLAAVDEHAASALNKSWRQDETLNKNGAWESLTEELVTAGLHKDADTLLKRRERILLNDEYVNDLLPPAVREGYVSGLVRESAAMNFEGASADYQLSFVSMRTQRIQAVYDASQYLAKQKSEIVVAKPVDAEARIVAAKSSCNQTLAKNLHEISTRYQLKKAAEIKRSAKESARKSAEKRKRIAEERAAALAAAGAAPVPAVPVVAGGAPVGVAAPIPPVPAGAAPVVGAGAPLPPVPGGLAIAAAAAVRPPVVSASEPLPTPISLAPPAVSHPRPVPISGAAAMPAPGLPPSGVASGPGVAGAPMLHAFSRSSPPRSAPASSVPGAAPAAHWAPSPLHIEVLNEEEGAPSLARPD